MAARTATDIVVLCENVLGWLPDPTKELWRERSVHAGRLKRAMAKHGYTIEQLELAVEFCRRRKEAVKTPAGLVFKVQRALEMANEPETKTTFEGQDWVTVKPETDLSTLVDEAISWEHMHEDHFSLGWITRLARAVGDYRLDVLKEWKEAGRG